MSYVYPPDSDIEKRCGTPTFCDYSSGACLEIADGTLWLFTGSEDNIGEFRLQINFCPFTGYEAKVKTKDGSE